jgi:hypothetical protein
LVPASFDSFFSASASSGAALAGLLFLAVTIGPIPTVGRRAPVERRAVATSAFIALINAFLLSLGALIPDASLGPVALGVGLVSLVATVRLGRELAQGRRGLAALARRLVLLAASAVLYVSESWQAAQLLMRPDDPVPVEVLASVLMPMYAIGILRAWELVGAERHGFLARFSPLRDLDQVAPQTDAIDQRPA